MPSYVVKADRDHDLYVMWSTVVDGPTATGTREEMAARHDVDEARLGRADEFGSSALSRGLGDWHDSGFVVKWDHTGSWETEFRWLPRKNLYAWLTTGDESLTEPCGDAVEQP